MPVLRTSGYASLPWKNGLGESRIIASHPPAAGYDAVDWQVGTTSIGADCPFSSLPGMDRQFMVLGGGGVELHCVDPVTNVNVRHLVDAPFAACAFRGEWSTTCRLLGDPVQVFNVMTRRGRVSAKVTVPRWKGPLYCEQRPDETVIAVVLSGQVKVAGVKDLLSPHDCVLLEASDGELCVIVSGGGDNRVAIVRLTKV